MAERRCISRKVIESDAFYSLPASAQAAYVHLLFSCDDDGVINCIDSVTKMLRYGRSSVNLLLQKRFLLQVNGLYIIKHWRMMNSFKNDRIKTLNYPEMAKKIWIKQNRAYTDHFVEGCKTLYEERSGIQMESRWNPNGIPTEPNQYESNRTKPNTTESMVMGFRHILGKYPKEKIGNSIGAEKLFYKTVPEDQLLAAEHNLDLWLQSEQWTKDNGRFVPMLANWLKNGIWATEPRKMRTAYGASGELGEAELDAIRQVMEDET